MDNDFAEPKTLVSLPEFSVIALWKVSVDSSYDVYRGMQSTAGDVFIRTISGEGTIDLKNGLSLRLSERTLLRIRNKDISRYYCSGENWEFWWYNCQPDDQLNLPADDIIPLGFDNYEEISSERILENLKSPFPLSNRIASADCLRLLLHWSEKIERKPGSLSEASRRMQPALWYINTHYEESIKVDYLASLTAYSIRNFRILFQGETGMSPIQYIRTYRLNGAVHKLLNTNLSIKEIALTTGFKTEQYFCRVFRKEFGESPFQYRKAVYMGRIPEETQRFLIKS